MELHVLNSREELKRFAIHDPLNGVDSYRSDGANLHLVATDKGQVTASCSLWWTGVPLIPGRQLGVIGHFSAAADGGIPLLITACQQLKRNGCTYAVGPMDGNTWRRYRLVTGAGSEPPFFMEPSNPPEWPGLFESSGFSPVARYRSLLNKDLALQDARFEAIEQRMKKSEITVRNLKLEEWENELATIHQISLQSFAKAFLFTPIPLSSFIASCEQLKPWIKPELVLIAERQQKPAGFLFTLPDPAEAQRGETVRTVIGKTLAVLPDRLNAGLGIYLTELLHQKSRAAGYTRVIHALEREGNRVCNMSGRYGDVMRRYSLFGRRLIDE
jgi:hypothetical protein